MIIGIDFDNTIAGYDGLMHRIAMEWRLIPATLPQNKKAIRDAIRALPDGESKWRGLQVFSYGPGMRDALPMDGIKEFLAACKGSGVPVAIVSHKTEYANFGDPTVNLRAAAVEWMAAQGLLDSREYGVGSGRVYFEETRQEKIARIRDLGITHFVDDLEETFLEDSFPRDVKKILYAPGAPHADARLWTSFPTWHEIRRHLLNG